MEEAWNVLRSAGVPLGIVSPLSSMSSDEAVRAALVRAVLDPGATDRGRDALRAWLDAFEHHWPSEFRRILGATGDSARAKLGPPLDPNRHLKLRRIAIEQLSALI